MDTTFKVIVEGVVKDAVIAFNDADDDSPERERARERLIELLKLNYPEFKDRYRHTGRTGNGIWFVAIDRVTPEDKKEPENIFA